MFVNLWNKFVNILLLASTLSVCPSCLEQCLLHFCPLCSVLYMAIPPTLCKGWYGTLLAVGEKHYAQLKVWGTPSGPSTSGFIFSQLMLSPVEVPCEATIQGPQNLGSSGDGGPSKNIDVCLMTVEIISITYCWASWDLTPFMLDLITQTWPTSFFRAPLSSVRIKVYITARLLTWKLPKLILVKC